MDHLNFDRVPQNKKKLEQIAEEISSMKKSALTDGRIIYGIDGQFKYALAPNGERSRLSERQWLQVRTNNFKQWFGDWEQDPERASKVIDQNSEPLILYHGTSRNFAKFDAHAPKTFETMDNTKGLFYLSSEKEFAEKEYAQFKRNLVIDMMRRFNQVFLNNGAATFDPLVEKWNEFVRSIGTPRVNLAAKKPRREGGYYDWTIVEFDGKQIISTDEIDMLWDKNLPHSFDEQDWEVVVWGGHNVTIPRNSSPIVMELFVKSTDPIDKQMIGTGAPQEMDNLFMQGVIEKGMNPAHEEHIEKSPSFGVRSSADSIRVKFPGGINFALGFFLPNQVKSAVGNSGLFSPESENILE